MYASLHHVMADCIPALHIMHLLRHGPSAIALPLLTFTSLLHLSIDVRDDTDRMHGLYDIATRQVIWTDTYHIRVYQDHRLHIQR